MTQALPSDFHYVENIVLQAKSSFAMGMKSLPKDRRGYLFAIYAYCRVLDDIADGEGTQGEKIAKLEKWQARVDGLTQGHAQCEITRILADAVEIHHIPTEELYKLIKGMRTDIMGPVFKPSWDELYEYCRDVAVSVGLLSLPLFGRRDVGAQKFATELGFALQLTNILRDIEEDYDDNRVYLPREAMEEFDVEDLSSPNLSAVLKQVAVRANHHYDNAECLLSEIGKESLGPALLMKAVYQKLLQKMKARGWHKISPRMRLSMPEKALIIMKHMSN